MNQPTRLSLCVLLTALFALHLSRVAAQEAQPAKHRQISGVYPHLTTYGIYSENGAHTKGGHDECGIGAVVPWAGRLWMINYAPHMPRGSEHKLFSIDAGLDMKVHPQSVGGTPAGRMIHRESNQLLIGPYLIDAKGAVRVITPAAMPARITAITRHLTDPANQVYYYDMEGALYEANVRTLKATKLFAKPVPGWHGKGAYVTQGRLVVSNNGEHAAGSYKPLLVGGAAKNDDEAGVLAEWDGKDWRIVERKQYTDVTGPDGIFGGKGASDDAPLWAMGWDRRSLRLKLLDGGTWHTFLLPKASLNNDAKHGWYTEWPRIREIGNGRFMMDMHGMFFDFPKSFAKDDTGGIRPIGSHLRYVPDFCEWNGKLVLATDETSIQGNKLAGQPQSNLWIGTADDLKQWGPASGFGGPWVGDAVKAGVPSDAFLIAGFDRRVLHLAVGAKTQAAAGAAGASGAALRASDQQKITLMPDALESLPRVTVNRGDWKKPAPGFTFEVSHDVTVYLAVDERGNPELNNEWEKTDLTLTWGENHRDLIYKRAFKAGAIEVPANETEHTKGSFGMPHTAFVASDAKDLKLKPDPTAKVSMPTREADVASAKAGEPVTFTLEVDVDGTGKWTAWRAIDVVDGGYECITIPPEVKAQWMRLTASRDSIATAFFHLTDASLRDPAEGRDLFAGLAEVSAKEVFSGVVYAAKQNRNLKLITSDDRALEFQKDSFTFESDELDAKLKTLLKTEPEFTVDEASVILMHRGKRLRLPKGDAAFDRPFAAGWPRGSREVESERHLAQFHGTFYEVPLLSNGDPPEFHLMRPVASHSKQIMDFCSWAGLLVLTGVRSDATQDGHVFIDPSHKAALWFGGVDDLWKLGKPVGRGGPWKDTPVKARQPSDPYLITGYDHKSLALTADKDVTITLEVDFDHQTGFHVYKSFKVTKGETTRFEFPLEFSAHWLRVKADADCTATAQLAYE
ncbi:MAG: hypothetical protein WD768_11010 [Phycisphaeraceae bacterium]